MRGEYRSGDLAVINIAVFHKLACSVADSRGDHLTPIRAGCAVYFNVGCIAAALVDDLQDGAQWPF